MDELMELESKLYNMTSPSDTEIFTKLVDVDILSLQLFGEECLQTTKKKMSKRMVICIPLTATWSDRSLAAWNDKSHAEYNQSHVVKHVPPRRTKREHKSKKHVDV